MCFPLCFFCASAETDFLKFFILLQVKPEDNNVEQAGAGGGRQKLIREVFLPRLLATKVCMFGFHDMVNFTFLYQHAENFTTFR